MPPSNALLLAVLLLPPLRDALDPDSNGVRDVGQLVAQAIAPALERLRPSRRDSELARQILLALRYILPSRNPRRKRPRLAGRDFFDEALRLAEIVSDAEGVDQSVTGRPIIAEGTTLGDGLPGEGEAEEIAAPELEPLDDYDDRRRRRGRGGRGPESRGPDGRGPDGRGPDARLHPRPARGDASRAEPVRVIAPIATDLISLAAAARSLQIVPLRPDFCGTGAFGGPWSRAD